MARRADIQYIRLYTDGSAARKLAPAYPGGKPERKIRVKKQKKLVVLIDPVAMAGIVVAACMLLLMVVGIGQYHAARQQTVQMERYVNVLQAENERLSQDYASGYDLKEVEKMAIALGMVPKDQVEHIPIRVSVPDLQQEPGTWERVVTFLTGLFA